MVYLLMILKLRFEYNTNNSIHFFGNFNWVTGNKLQLQMNNQIIMASIQYKRLNFIKEPSV